MNPFFPEPTGRRNADDMGMPPHPTPAEGTPIVARTVAQCSIDELIDEVLRLAKSSRRVGNRAIADSLDIAARHLAIETKQVESTLHTTKARLEELEELVATGDLLLRDAVPALAASDFNSDNALADVIRAHLARHQTSGGSKKAAAVHWNPDPLGDAY